MQEALTNAVEHVSAHTVSIVLNRRDGSVTALVEDDGQGLAPEEARRGLGLVAMRERMALLDGSLRIESSPSARTTVVAEVPLR